MTTKQENDITIEDIYKYYRYQCEEKKFFPYDFLQFQDAFHIYVIFNPGLDKDIIIRIKEWLNNISVKK